MKLNYEYEIRMLVEILFEKGLINQATYLNIKKELKNETRQSAA